MPFIGNQPALSFTSFAKQDFTTSATTSYTLDNPVANANELALFINFVRQEPTTAYSASGTTLTLTSATSSSDDMYCVYLGKAVQTVNPPNASVGASQLVDASITSGKLASGVLPANTPAFGVYMSSSQSSANNTYTKINFDTEDYDTDNAYDTSTNRFTVPSGQAGKYIFHVKTMVDGVDDIERTEVVFYKNGSIELKSFELDMSSSADSAIFANTTFSFNLVAGDYIEAYAKHTEGGTRNIESGYSYFFGHKLIG